MQTNKLLLILFCCSLTLSVQGADKSLASYPGAGAPTGGGAVGGASGGAGAAEGGSGEGVLGVDAAREIQRVWRGYHVRVQQAQALNAALAYFPTRERVSLSKALRSTEERAETNPDSAIYAWGEIARVCPNNKGVRNRCLDNIDAYAEKAPDRAITMWGDVAEAYPNNEVVRNRCLNNIDTYAEEAPGAAVRAWGVAAKACANNEAVVMHCLDGIERCFSRIDSYHYIYAMHKIASSSNSLRVIEKCFRFVYPYYGALRQDYPIVQRHLELIAKKEKEAAAFIKLFGHAAKVRRNRLESEVFPAENDPVFSLMKLILTKKASRQVVDNGTDSRLTFNHPQELQLNLARYLGLGVCAGIGNKNQVGDPAPEKDCPICVRARECGIVDAPAPVAEHLCCMC